MDRCRGKSQDGKAEGTGSDNDTGVACPQLIPILDAIIISQKEGIRQMKKLLDMASSPFDRDHI